MNTFIRLFCRSRKTKFLSVIGALALVTTFLGSGISMASAAEDPCKGKSGAAAITCLAKDQIGDSYRWGGTGMTTWDCSGLAQASFKEAGIKIPRTTYDQWKDVKDSSGALHSVSKSELQPGDLVYFNTDGNLSNGPDHVGIYVGNGKFVHAPNSNSKVKTSKLSDYGGYMGAGRGNKIPAQEKKEPADNKKDDKKDDKKDNKEENPPAEKPSGLTPAEDSNLKYCNTGNGGGKFTGRVQIGTDMVDCDALRTKAKGGAGGSNGGPGKGLSTSKSPTSNPTTAYCEKLGVKGMGIVRDPNGTTTDCGGAEMTKSEAKALVLEMTNPTAAYCQRIGATGNTVHQPDGSKTQC